MASIQGLLEKENSIRGGGASLTETPPSEDLRSRSCAKILEIVCAEDYRDIQSSLRRSIVSNIDILLSKKTSDFLRDYRALHPSVERDDDDVRARIHEGMGCLREISEEVSKSWHDSRIPLDMDARLDVFMHIRGYSEVIDKIKGACQRWIRPSRHSPFHVQLFGHALFYFDRVLSSGVVTSTDQKPYLYWATISVSLAKKFLRDDNLRSNDISSDSTRHVVGWTNIDVAQGEQRILDILGHCAYRATVFSFLSVWKEEGLQRPDVWNAAHYLGTTALFISDLALLPPSRLSLLLGILATRLYSVDRWRWEGCVQDIFNKVDIRDEIRSVARIWLCRRPDYTVLRTLFPELSHIPGQRFLDAWSPLWGEGCG